VRELSVAPDESEVMCNFEEVLALLDSQERERFSEQAHAGMRQYIQRQKRLSDIRAHEKIDARVAQKFVETAVNVTRDSVESEYQEPRRGLAFKLLQTGRGVYIPMAPDYCNLTGVRRMSWDDATLEHKPEFDRHPTAKMVYPVSSWYWKVLCFQWLFDAGLDIADLLSDANMCVSLALSESSVDLPDWVKHWYISLTVLSFVAEVVSALYIVCTTDSDRRALDEIHGRYPIWRANRWCPNFLIVKTWVQFVFLRYLAVPERLISPHDTFLTHDHGGLNHFLPFDHDDLKSDRSDLAVYVTDRVRYEYRVVEGYLAKVPKFIVEDILVCSLAVYMAFLLRSSAAISASITGCFSFGRGMQKLSNYVMAARNKRRSLVAYGSSAADDLRKFDANPVRRLITLRTGQSQGD